jgi:hypothetical protein
LAVNFFDLISWKGACHVEKEQQFEEEEPFVLGVNCSICFVHNRRECGRQCDRDGGIAGLRANGLGDRL